LDELPFDQNVAAAVLLAESGMEHSNGYLGSWVDLGKTICNLVGQDMSATVVFRKRVQRFQLLDFLANLSSCIVAWRLAAGHITLAGIVSNSARSIG
jgi:hypothetical protein